MISPRHIIWLHKSETSENEIQILRLKIKILRVDFFFFFQIKNIGIKKLSKKNLLPIRPLTLVKGSFSLEFFNTIFKELGLLMLQTFKFSLKLSYMHSITSLKLFLFGKRKKRLCEFYTFSLFFSLICANIKIFDQFEI